MASSDLKALAGKATGVTADSRQVRPGNVFVVIKGAKEDGARFIEEAIAKGAIAIVASEEWRVKSEKDPATRHPLLVTVANTRLALAQLAATLHEPQPKHITAITGTDGKTSTADFFRQLCALAGHKAASIGTLGVIGSAKKWPALHTTPDPVLLHQTLQGLALEGIDYVAMEASSHGLDQYRLHGVKVSAAAFTNLTRDHMDYHKTPEDYFAAKLKLFTEILPPGGTAVLSADDARYAQIAAKIQDRKVMSYGKAGKDYTITSLRPQQGSVAVEARIHGTPHAFTLPMVGTFQAMNLLAAMALAEACGIAPATSLAVIAKLKPVPGRLELAATLPTGAPVFVDYAHTQAALQNVLTAVRPHVAGKLWVVFGCGGDRDKGKRPEMGKIAARFADHAVVTDDNPRSEDPAAIRREILSPLSQNELGHVREIADRSEAIAFAVRSLHKGDGLVIAGKGHEKTQTYKDKVLPFDDVQAAREAVKLL